MSRIVEDIYQSLAFGITENINNTWEKATLSVEFFEDSADFKGEYFTHKTKKFFEVSDHAFDDFEELYKLTTENPVNKWNRAKFTLESTGDFNMEFEWDQELADEIEQLNSE